jgi:hypothetical protein
MRKKTLKFKEFRRGDGGDSLVLHDRLRDCDYEVNDPHLSEEQVQQVTEEIKSVLNTTAAGEASVADASANGQ